MLSDEGSRYWLIGSTALGDVVPGLGPRYGLELEGCLKFDTEWTERNLDETFGFDGSSRVLWRWLCGMSWLSERKDSKKLDKLAYLL